MELVEFEPGVEEAFQLVASDQVQQGTGGFDGCTRFNLWRRVTCRERGLHRAFLELYRSALATRLGPWARELPGVVEDYRRAGRADLESIRHSLDVPWPFDSCWSARRLTSGLAATEKASRRR